MKILLVDDDPIVVLLQKKLMEKAGILDPVISFNNGEDAVSYLVEHAGDEDKDYLLFLDINMPGLSGWDVLDTVAEIKLPVRLAVIIITSSIETADKDKAKRYDNIIDFWVKPFNIMDFVKLKQKKELKGFFD
ncbi:response regulator [Negadavirga shengliensis]|uniref:Response regulator n=1 Tax=Negadavirga shengliensis TaxID=1389218 RepID=A0ABV9SWX7_9BACT